MRGKTPCVPTVVLAAEYMAGDTLRELAARYGISFQTIAQQLRNAGVERRPPRARKWEDRTCLTCGKVFRPRSSTQRWCSPACVPYEMFKRLPYCKRGHEMTNKNTYVRPNGWRRCRECMKIIQAAYRSRRKGVQHDTKL